LHKIPLLTVLLLALALSLSGQRGTLHGEVFEGAEPLEFATIEVVGSEISAVTDTSGQFTLELSAGEHTLIVSYVGMIPARQKVAIQPGQTEDVIFDLTQNHQLDEVVVTGTLKPSYVSESPVKIDVINAKQLETFIPAASASAVEAVTMINGVEEVVACGVCFTNTISINGLPGQYTAILMDGMPMYGNLASVYGLNGIPNMIIDRFEVIKGPSSTLYGSEAVAGVLNIITKDPADSPLFEIDIMGTTHKESFGNFAFAPKVGKTNGFIGLNYAYINDFDDRNNDGFGDVANLDRISFFTKWDIHRNSGKKFTVAGKYFFEDRRNGLQEFLEDRAYRDLRGSDSVYGESIYTNRIELFGTYEFNFTENIRLDYSFSAHDQDSYYGTDHYVADQKIAFGNFIWNKELGSHDLTAGISLRYQAYDDNTVATEIVEDGDTTNLPDNQFIPGIFIQDEWRVNNKWTLLPGMRVDYYENHGLIPAPRLSAKFKASPWTTLRANFGTGFKIVNLFTEDHAFVTGQREVVIEEALDPEQSISGALNVNHIFSLGNASGSIDVDAYYTYFTNKIIPDYDSPGQIVYRNAEGSAKTMGIATTVNFNFALPLGIQLGFNLQNATQTESDENGMLQTTDIEFTPDYTGLFTINYAWKKADMTFAYTARLTGPIVLPEVFDLDENGLPYQLKHPELAKYRRRKRRDE